MQVWGWRLGRHDFPECPAFPLCLLCIWLHGLSPVLLVFSPAPVCGSVVRLVPYTILGRAANGSLNRGRNGGFR